MPDPKKEKPTAIRLLKQELARFLASAAPEVLCIRGKWGVGKTYSWNEELIAARDRENGIALKRYAYVSLFGVQSLDQLKYSIFENTVESEDIGTVPTIENLRKNSIAVSKQFGRRALAKLVSYIPFIKDAVGTLQVISFLTVKNQLICIDDLERKGAGLRTQDVVGLISFLREHRDCKVVLVLNDEELGADKEQLEKFQEKVIDASLLYAPTAAECAEIALKGNDEVTKKLAERVTTLNLSNIRIIKKIERLVRRVEPLLAEYDPRVLTQAISTLALLGWGFFARVEGSGTSLIDFAVKKRGQSFFGGIEKVKLNDDEQRWDKLMDDYVFTNTDEFDIALLDGIKAGFFDEDGLKVQAKVLHEALLAQSADHLLSVAWQRVHDSFDDDQDEVVNGIIESFVAHVQHISIGNFNSTVKFFKDLGLHEQAQEAIEFYMEERKSESPSFFDLEEYPFTDEIDPDARAAFETKFVGLVVARDPKEILQRISRENAWNQRDIQALNDLDVDDYEEIFRELRGKELRAAVGTIKIFDTLHTDDQQLKYVAETGKAALFEISDDSLLNKRRVRRLGFVKPEPEEKAGE